MKGEYLFQSLLIVKERGKFIRGLEILIAKGFRPNAKGLGRIWKVQAKGLSGPLKICGKYHCSGHARWVGKAGRQPINDVVTCVPSDWENPLPLHNRSVPSPVVAVP
jgi:hypothetical protein